MDVEWVTEPTEGSLDRSVALAYGNEATLGIFYHQLCVIVMLMPEDIANATEPAESAQDVPRDVSPLHAH